MMQGMLGSLGGMLGGEEEEEQDNVKVYDIDVKSSPEDILRLNSKRPKQDMVKKHKTRQDYVRDALSTLAGMLVEEPECDSEGSIFDEGYEYLGDEKHGSCCSKGILSSQEYASNLNRHSKAGGV